MLLALFSLFAPASVVATLDPEGARFTWFARVVLGAIVTSLVVQRWLPPAVIHQNDPFFVLWNVYAAVVIGVLLYAAWRPWRRRIERTGSNVRGSRAGPARPAHTGYC
jgi:Na+/proline symporter